jgi:outer membrane protein assembly factor BamB
MFLLSLLACHIDSALDPTSKAPFGLDSGAPAPDTAALDTGGLPAEDCNGLDDDGDGDVDEGYGDLDGDGVADCIDDACTAATLPAGSMPVDATCGSATGWVPADDPGDFRIEWAVTGPDVTHSPIIANLTDDNGDGRIDEADTPDILVVDYMFGDLSLYSGDGGALHWTRELGVSPMGVAVADGVLAAPVLSADGETIYVNGRDRRLWALHTKDGTPKWSAALDFQPQTPPTIAPGGLIIAGGGPDTRLVALNDSGDRAEVVWRRDDVAPLTTSSQAGAVAYAVVAEGNGQSLLVFDPADGHTLNSYPLDQAAGFPVGVSVGTDRRVVVATSAGQVYSFSPS